MAVTLVDSGSTDSTPDMVAAEFPAVELIRQGNIGFSAANNIVLRRSEAQFILLLNPNNEIYGRPSDAPWAVQIHQWDLSAGRAVTDASGDPIVLGTFQPTFLYESIFCLMLAILLLLLDRQRAFKPGQLFALYIAGYPVFRIVIETMRTDEAKIIFGQRLNVWTSLAVFLLGVGLYAWLGRRPERPGSVSQNEKMLTTS